jgi:hypothetical protein
LLPVDIAARTLSLTGPVSVLVARVLHAASSFAFRDFQVTRVDYQKAAKSGGGWRA